MLTTRFFVLNDLCTMKPIHHISDMYIDWKNGEQFNQSPMLYLTLCYIDRATIDQMVEIQNFIVELYDTTMLVNIRFGNYDIKLNNDVNEVEFVYQLVYTRNLELNIEDLI